MMQALFLVKGSVPGKAGSLVFIAEGIDEQ